MEKRTRELATEATEKLKDAFNDIAERTRAAGESALDAARDACEVAGKKASAGARYTDKAVHDHPYGFVGAAFSIGLLIGFLLKRR
jgi:ElaB/YqjD/DUF883 family membrane-anchored ribosome-binding protein